MSFPPHPHQAVLAVRALGGVARTRTLRDQHISTHQLRRAMNAGALIPVRRGWVAVPDADPMLVESARFGVVLSCITQAKRLGLWVHEADAAVHVAAAPSGRGGHPDVFHVHWAKPVVPRHPDVLVDPIENVLALVADCEPFERALATWDAALNQGLASRSGLARLPMKTVARRLLAEATPFADSGLESYLRPRLRWLRLPLRFQIWIAGHRVDTLIGDRLILQIDGATHTGAQRDEDIRHDAELMLMGYYVIRVGYHQVMDEWHVVQDLIMRAVAQGLHLARAV